MSTVKQAVVLLSGGMDSVAALHWAVARYASVRSIGFDYGQQSRDGEVSSAGTAARELDVQHTLLVLADAFAVRLGLLGNVPDHDPGAHGVHPAFLPNRNAVLLNVAALHACAWFPNGNIDLVFGANAEDAAGFPDCRATYLSELASVLRKGCARQIKIVAPWVELSKGGIVASLHANEAAVADIRRSWSCYRRGGPCGTCSACVLRAKAFAAAGLVDESAWPSMNA